MIQEKQRELVVQMATEYTVKLVNVKQEYDGKQKQVSVVPKKVET